MIPDVFGLRGMAIGAVVALVVGFGAGWSTNGWRLNGQHAKAENDRKDHIIQTLTSNNAEKDRLLGEEAERLQRERVARSLAEDRLNEAYDANARLASSRATNTTRIIERAQEIGNELESTNPCIRVPWPDSLLAYANGFDRPGSNLPVPSAYPDPNGEQGPVPGRTGADDLAGG